MTTCLTSISAAGIKEYNMITFSWDLLDACQYKCTYCSAVSFNQHTFFKDTNNRNIWKTVVKRLSLKSIDMPFNVELLGGEPSLHPDIVQLIESLCAIEKCIQVELTSNIAKPISFFKKLDTEKCSKLDIVASYHPEYFTRNYIDKIIEISQFKYIKILPLINLPDDKKYWEQTATLIQELLRSNVSISLNLLFNYHGMDWYPGYTQEFWDYFKEWIVPPIDVDVNDWTNRTLLSKFDKPIIANRGRVFYNKDGRIVLKDADIYQNKLFQYKGWKCRPLMWKINMDGTIVNHCTNELVSHTGLNKNNLSKIITCPLDCCDCNTKYQYYKHK